MLDVINKYEESKSAEDIAVQEVKSKLNKKITAFDVEALFKNIK